MVWLNLKLDVSAVRGMLYLVDVLKVLQVECLGAAGSLNERWWPGFIVAEGSVIVRDVTGYR
jgi:hypothetical protein